MRHIRFESVPRDVAERLREQRDAAMQILAALLLTEDEVTGIQYRIDPDFRPRDWAGWASVMRGELLSGRWRPRLVEVIERQGFSLNTHPGFSVAALVERVPPEHHLASAFAALEEMLQRYAAGDGEGLRPEDAREVLAARLVEAGHSQDVATYCVRWTGYRLFLEAAMERQMREG